MVPGNVKVLEQGRDGRAVGTYRVTVVNGRRSNEAADRPLDRARPIDEQRLSAPESMYGGTTEVPGTDGAARPGWRRGTTRRGRA